MTLLQVLNLIHALLEGDTSTPLTGEDYSLRVLLVNNALQEWGAQADTKWRELYDTDDTHTGDGVETRFALPVDFQQMNGPIYLVDPTSGFKTAISPTTAARSSQFVNDPDVTCWIEGTSLVFNQAPDDAADILIPYYKRPTTLTDNTDLLPLSNPLYVVHYVVARLVEQSGDFTRYNTNMQKAEELLLQMKIANDSLGEGVPNQIQSFRPGFGV